MLKVIKNNIYLFRFIKKYAKSMLFFILLSGAISAMFNVINVIGIKEIVDLIASEGAIEKKHIILIVTYCSAVFLFNTFFVMTGVYMPIQIQKISNGISIERFEASKKLDYQCFDNSEFYNKYTMSLQSGEGQVNLLIGALIALVNNVLTAIGLIATFMQYSYLYIIPIIIEVVINLIVATRQKNMDYNYQIDTVKLSRKDSYYKNIYISPSSQKENKLFPIFDLIKIKFIDNSVELLKKLKKYGVKRNLLEVVLKFVSFLTLLYTMLLSCHFISLNILTVGVFIATITGLERLKGQILSLVSQVPSLVNNAKYVDCLKVVLEYEPQIEKDEGISVKESSEYEIEFCNVSFKYPSFENYILKNISFKVKTNDILAVVGENGEGKTTIMKLLLRLYDPTEGEIKLNGVNIKEYHVDSYRKLFSSIFQDFNLYNITIKENIAFSNSSNVDDVLEKVSIYNKISNMPLKSDTSYTKVFDDNGEYFSQGEIQKLCIGRAFYKDCEIVLLDEPSSNLDAIMEDKINSIIKNESHNKLLVFISHRLSMCKNASEIIFLKEGRIVESGTHEQLMSQKGNYYEMFTIQADQYAEEINN